jgi:hypothetical protein
MSASTRPSLVLAVACVIAAVVAFFSSLGVAPAARDPRPPGALPGDGGPSPVVFPPQSIGVRFNHARHIALGATCTTCHDKAKTSRSSADSLLPGGTRCDGCHGTNHREANVVAGADALGQCAYCHIGYRPEDGQRVLRTVIPPPHLRFDHAAHTTRGIGCAACHGDVGSFTQATFDQLPRMRGCFSCHTHDAAKRGQASRACPTCHITERGALLVTAFPEGQLEPPAWLHDSAHGGDWLLRHKRIAADDSRFCANCHTENECMACHDGRVRPRSVHPNDFLSMHAVAARQNSPVCTSCHQQQSFCLGCHQRAGVTLSGPVGNVAQRGRFHPPPSVWTDAPRGAGHHAWEAERNLNACVSCHMERDCVNCHATAAVGGIGSGLPSGDPGSFRRGTDPHPPGFFARCGRALRQNPRPCLSCHDPSDRALDACR